MWTHAVLLCNETTTRRLSQEVSRTPPLPAGILLRGQSDLCNHGPRPSSTVSPEEGCSLRPLRAPRQASPPTGQRPCPSPNRPPSPGPRQPSPQLRTDTSRALPVVLPLCEHPRMVPESDKGILWLNSAPKLCPPWAGATAPVTAPVTLGSVERQRCVFARACGARRWAEPQCRPRVSKRLSLARPAWWRRWRRPPAGLSSLGADRGGRSPSLPLSSAAPLKDLLPRRHSQ